jgi:uncharacterized membrane-anchored protein YhcB (DUF1043 family)
MTTGIETGWVLAFGFAILAIGVIVGIVIGYFGLGDSRKSQELQNKLDALQQEFDEYKDKVSKHFMQTSELVQKMTSSYREVYEHLASGSEELCSAPVVNPQLDFPDRPTLEANKDSHREAENTPPATPSEAAQPATTHDDDEVLGDTPKVPDLDLEIARPEKATDEVKT